MLFLAQLLNFFMVALIGAAIFSLHLGHYYEGGVILLFAFLKSCTSVYLEDYASQSIDRMSKLAEHTCMVLRQGNKAHIPTSALVPGDIVLLKKGDVVSPRVFLVFPFCTSFSFVKLRVLVPHTATYYYNGDGYYYSGPC